MTPPPPISAIFSKNKGVKLLFSKFPIEKKGIFTETSKFFFTEGVILLYYPWSEWHRNLISWIKDTQTNISFLKEYCPLIPKTPRIKFVRQKIWNIWKKRKKMYRSLQIDWSLKPGVWNLKLKRIAHVTFPSRSIIWLFPDFSEK